MLDATRTTFKSEMNPPQQQSIDEGMIKYKGRFFARQYMPSKPVKRGLKVRSYWHTVSVLSNLLLCANSECNNKMCSCLTLTRGIVCCFSTNVSLIFIHNYISIFVFLVFQIFMRCDETGYCYDYWPYMENMTSFMESHWEREL